MIGARKLMLGGLPPAPTIEFLSLQFTGGDLLTGTISLGSSSEPHYIIISAAYKDGGNLNSIDHNAGGDTGFTKVVQTQASGSSDSKSEVWISNEAITATTGTLDFDFSSGLSRNCIFNINAAYGLQSNTPTSTDGDVDGSSFGLSASCPGAQGMVVVMSGISGGESGTFTYSGSLPVRYNGSYDSREHICMSGYKKLTYLSLSVSASSTSQESYSAAAFQ